jgi:hypothetical protein
VKLADTVFRALLLLGAIFLCCCSEQQVVAELRSLSGSEDAVFLCRDANGEGHPYSDCPDRDATDDAKKAKQLAVFALVTQTVTDEVAVVDVSTGKVVDVDPSTPGYGFLRVGGRPQSLAATPGGRATFVATADVGRNGIFALPTTCLGAPNKDKHELQRDLTTWPACRLDETPGEITVLVEPFAATAPAPSPFATLDGTACRVDDYSEAGDPTDLPDTLPAADAGTPGQCQAALQGEGGPEGRRKLLVALPDSGELGVLDAQELLNVTPGSFPPCHFEQRVKLQVDVPAGTTQILPADLTGSLFDPDPSAVCGDALPPQPTLPTRGSPQPAGIALVDDRLYVADQGAPVVHVVDTSSVCGMQELASLLPMSLREPQRIVTTKRVAVSPLTPAGRRFAYAIDAEDQPGASVMVFDVSPGATDRTPLVRSGSPELPGEAKPDRLYLGSSAKDVTFAYRDIPYVDPNTGVAEFGVRCNPDPTADVTSQGALARTSTDFVNGARPGLLRGLFGFILLTNGSIAVVDEDDFDSDCRRPVSVNSDSTPDFRGCANDDPNVDSYVIKGGGPTVSDEVSCRVVEPHRFRASRFSINNAELGARAPSLRDFPQLTLPKAAASSAFEDRPRLLAVPFSGGEDGKGNAIVLPADVYVGTTHYSTDQKAADVAAVNPNSRDSEQLQSVNSVVLPPLEPRSYAAEDTVTVTYEGSFAGDRTAGFLYGTEQDQPTASLKDASLSYCGAGVYDVDSMTDYAARELGLSKDEPAKFGEEHADYVQLTASFPAADDTYWRKVGVTRAACIAKFGAPDADPLPRERDFSIRAAFADHLVLGPRGAKPAPWRLANESKEADVARCFPTALTYRVRASNHWVLTRASTGFRHDIIAAADGRCVRSCDPIRKWSRGRVFEISSDRDHCLELPLKPESDPLDLRVGCAAEGEVACKYDQSVGAVALGGPGSECIFNGLNDRFALYRGRSPSLRDTAFTWHTTGGFTPLLMSLATLSPIVMPQSIQFLRQPEQMAVVDGASQGLSLFSLDTFSVVKPSPFY